MTHRALFVLLNPGLSVGVVPLRHVCVSLMNCYGFSPTGGVSPSDFVSRMLTAEPRTPLQNLLPRCST
jgi:hypothetical protein